MVHSFEKKNFCSSGAQSVWSGVGNWHIYFFDYRE